MSNTGLDESSFSSDHSYHDEKLKCSTLFIYLFTNADQTLHGMHVLAVMNFFISY